MKLLLLSRYSRLGASSRMRFYQYLPYLEMQRVEVDIAPLFDDDYLLQLYNRDRRGLSTILRAYLHRIKVLGNVTRYDLVWMEKELFPMLPAAFERLLHLINVPYVVDYDDAVFHNYDQHRSRLVRGLLGRKIDAVMRFAHTVVVGNEYLAARARLAGAGRVVVLPTVVDIGRYTSGPDRATDGIVIGWVGSPSTTKYLLPLRPPLARLYERYATRFVAVGAGVLDFPGVQIEFRDWNEDQEIAEIQSFDIGVMPLPDEPFARGKCGYKLVQYMAAGLPVVASPVGVNTTIVKHGVNGFLASTEQEWYEALDRLRKSPDLRARMGVEGRKQVEREYCIQVTAPRLSRLIFEASRVRGAR